MATISPFIDRLAPASRNSGLSMEDYWIWCGSVVKSVAHEDAGRYHMFASRWTKKIIFGHWVTNSEVIRASSPTPAGPYTFDEVALPWRHRKYFDGVVTHNPMAVAFEKSYYLFYTGVTYDFDIPTPERQMFEGKYAEHFELFKIAWQNKRVGLAVSDSPSGPWRRPDRPLIEPRRDDWDALITSNPTAAVRDDGFTVLIYKSRRDWTGPFQLGVATAPHPAGPYTRAGHGPIFPFNCEDPFIWWEGNRFHMIMKDFDGAFGGEAGAGIYTWSEDGLRWTFDKDPRAYSRTIKWDDGTSSTHGNVERPSLLLENGKPTHLVVAISSGPLPHWQSESTRNVVIPLKD